MLEKTCSSQAHSASFQAQNKHFQIHSVQIQYKVRRVKVRKLRKAKSRNGAPCRIRTCGVLIRSQTLYPAEVRAHSNKGYLPCSQATYHSATIIRARQDKFAEYDLWAYFC